MSHFFLALFCVALEAVPSKTGDEANIQAGNQIAQGGQGMIILVEGNFGIGLTARGGGIPVEFGLGQEIRTSRAENLEPAGPQPGVDGRDTGLNCVAASEHLQAGAAQLFDLRRTRRVGVPHHARRLGH